MENIIINTEPPQKMSVAEAKATKCPMQAMLDRIIVIQCNDGDRKKSELYIPEHIKATTFPNQLTQAVIKSVGKISSGRDACVKEGDVVWMFPFGFESKIVMDDIEFISYGERDVVAKIKNEIEKLKN